MVSARFFSASSNFSLLSAMFFRSTLALSLASLCLTSPVKRFGSVTVDIVGPSGTISSIDDLKLTATVTNTGAETVKILKYGTILDEKLPTKSFVVTKNGKTVPFSGIKVSWILFYSFSVLVFKRF